MEPIKIKATGAVGEPKKENKKVEMKTKSISFNILDESQKEMYRHAAGKSNFSGYIKELIMRDMFGYTGRLNN